MNVKIGSRLSIHRTNLLCACGAAMAIALLNLLDRVEVEGRIRRVLADAHDRVADEIVRRHGKIVGRRHILEDAAREVVARAVARTEIAALPGWAEEAPGLRHEFRNTAKMGADRSE